MYRTILTLLTLTLFSAESFGQQQIRIKNFNAEKGVGIQCYDPVAYFTQNKAIKGNSSFVANAEGITYHFASATNKEAFLKNYKKYEPQYGGWCAYAMGASGEKVDIDPETFKVEDGKLYLFYHSWTNNTLPKWNANEATLKPNADKNWSNLFR